VTLLYIIILLLQPQTQADYIICTHFLQKLRWESLSSEQCFLKCVPEYKYVRPHVFFLLVYRKRFPKVMVRWSKKNKNNPNSFVCSGQIKLNWNLQWFVFFPKKRPILLSVKIWYRISLRYPD
jgi:hypothetical protein